MTRAELQLTSSSTPPVRLADLCDLALGVIPAHSSHRREGASLAGMRIVRASDLFRERPVGQELSSDTVAYRRSPERARLRQGDIVLPMVARTLRARLVDSALEGCVPTHTIAVLRPHPGAPPASTFMKLLSSKEFTDAVERTATARFNGRHRLLIRDLLELRVTLPVEDEGPSESVVALMDRVVRDIIRAIARNSEELRHVEWRILEHVLATAFEELGFDVQLTPSSRDGGKDIVLECMERGTRRRYAVEIKHWVSGQAVPGSHLKKFLRVVVNEKHDSGLFLSTSGFAQNAYDALIHLEHKRMRVAGKDKILKLCELYVSRQSGIWTSERPPSEVLFDYTDVPQPSRERLVRAR